MYSSADAETSQCLCPSRPSSDQSTYSEQPSPSTTNDSDDVIGHRVGLKNLAEEKSLNLDHGLQPDDGEIAFSNVHTSSLQSISVEQNTSEELMIFACPLVGRLCFFQTSDIDRVQIPTARSTPDTEQEKQHVRFTIHG